jgi:hypothetical protein
MNFVNIFLALAFFTYLSDALKIVCEKNYSKFNNCIADGFNEIDKHLEIYCDPNMDIYSLVILPNRRLTLESDSHIILHDCSIGQIVLNNFRTLSVETSISVEYDFVQLYIYNSDFVFESFERANFTPNLFKLNGIRSVSFRNDIRYPKQETSPHIFKNSLLTFLEFFELTNSSSKRNYFEFKDESDITSLNSNISELQLFVYKLTLSNKVLNEDVFEKLEKLMIFNQLYYIEPDTFKPFKNLKQIYCEFYSLKAFFHRGARWLEGLNYRNENKNAPNKITVAFVEDVISTSKNAYSFPDYDFCLFKYFPRHRQVVLFFNDCVRSCTFLWLIQNSDSFSLCVNSTRLNCNFTELLENCQSIEEYRVDSAINYENDYYLKDFYFLEKKLDFVLWVIVFPIVCLLGSGLNILNVLVLSNKNHKKEMQQRMYELMLVSSVINFLVCFIYLFRLTIKCIDPINNYCPVSLITNKTFRYIFLTLVNYFGNVLKTTSNLLQISIAVDRIQLATQAKFSWLKVHSKTNMKYLMLTFFALSLAINFIKLFQYDYNLDFEFLRYPLISRNYFNFNFWYSYFNFAHIFFNNVCIVFIQVIIDVILLNLIKKSWKKIQAEIRSYSMKHLLMKNEKIERNIRIMIIISGVCLFLLHIPDLVISIYMETTYIIKFQLKDSTDSFIDTRSLVLFSFLFNIISDIIYFLGFSLNTLLYYVFNSVFRRSMRDLLS